MMSLKQKDNFHIDVYYSKYFCIKKLKNIKMYRYLHTFIDAYMAIFI